MAEPVHILNHSLPLVTIAIPTYNRVDCYLPASLESARKQTYSNLEIIVADNCSSDQTETFVTSITDPRIRYFKHRTNIGSNRNCNFCIQEARGEYFLLLCDDDLIDNDFVESCIKASRSGKDFGIVRTGIRLIDQNGQIFLERPNMAGGHSTEDFFRDWFAGKSPLYLCNTLYHTRRLIEIGGFKSKSNLYDDAMATVLLASKYGRLDIQEIKASARFHASELTFAEDIGQWCDESLLLLDLMCELSTQNRELIRQEGMRVFSQRNYRRAMAIQSTLKRIVAYMIIYRKFNYRFPPPLYLPRLHKLKITMKRVLQIY